MDRRRLALFALAGAALAVDILAAPASAAVRYDPGAKTGFVGGADVRRAFGWTESQLAAKAGGIAFNQDFWTDDNYAVACGGTSFAVVHRRVFGRYELIGFVTRQRGRGAATGYHGRLTGFRLAGARAGISGTSVAPAAGLPCPKPGRGTTISRAVRVSTREGWSLSATSGAVTRVLLTNPVSGR